MSEINLLELLPHINPAMLNYSEWLAVGQALKYEGYAADDWDQWSMADSRYHPGECQRKWNTFQGSGNPITGGTIVKLAKDHGWKPADHKEDRAIGWDDIISDEYIVVDSTWVEGKEIQPPKHWNPAQEIIRYLETLFEAGENVGYVTESWEKDGRYLPTKGCCDRTAGQLIQELSRCGGDIGAVLGDYTPEAGAWIRFNPLDGAGVKNENVTDFRYALVESDNMPIDKQNAMIRELELPVAALVYSGGKSIHAIVRIEAVDYNEYRKRVDYLYQILKKNGFDLDTQNKNPSRLSRLPGVERRGQKQFLIDTNIGKESWAEWKEWIEGINDNLPDPESLSDVWENMPELSPPLIDGVLRQGHKMLLAGPSKAGKSYALIELCIAIAEGKKWFNWQCTKGRIMYVNLELDRPSCLHRFRDVYNGLHVEPNNIGNIDIWNLRGNSIPMDKLAPKLIRRAAKKGYIAIIIDPIYKVITGDENSADQMANFCNQFDKVCHELQCAVIYCHHHSKGLQGAKRSMDRASGSGVFARDPDAILDYIELEVTDEVKDEQENEAVCAICRGWLDKYHKTDEFSQDDLVVSEKAENACIRAFGNDYYLDYIQPAIYAARQRMKARTAWRIDGTLREFPKFTPVNTWFDYPIHTVDDTVLQDLDEEGAGAPYQRGGKATAKKKKSQSDRKKEKIIDGINNSNFGEPPTVDQLCEYLSDMNLSRQSLIRWIKKFGYHTERQGKNEYLVIKDD